ncbi:amidophosphoribosyltransferase [Danio rerio]|uniref:Amidophosphoribosyltransferase n=1 Tax=Danio rerio TaxID=7955 RepID=A6H8S4_DANRE|nr:amidophosphoribosyltransferase [Danio rerio]AAI46731.1 Phosphoribosyl pyrophosphate amidotransferase [Danio rerio]|eukprot:NP_001076346.2 amidophosphoribosyltransferase [Danio rerio]
MEFEESGIGEECGVFGCVAAGEWPTQLEVAQILTLGLVALQHRGQESAGIVTSTGTNPPTFSTLKGMGLVNTAFKPEDLLKLRYGNLGIGHTRYSTTGISELHNCQPFVVDTLHGKIAVAHNGELVNASALRKKVMRHGVGLSTCSDSELITQLLALTPPMEELDNPDWVARIKNLMTETPTSYSLLVMYKDVIYAVRDPYGNRPLCIGRLVPISKLHSSGAGEADTEGWVVSSESCSFQSIGAKYYREVKPGEIVQISKNGVESLSVVPRPEGDLPAFCIFEYVYFARPDSMFEGQMVYTVRQRCGRQLAIEAPTDADVVSTVPESATPAALGYAQQSGLPYVEVLCKNRYVGRTFIQPNTRLRQLGVAKKFGALTDNLAGKRVVLIDDSIVRGNTISPIIKLLKEAGATEVHIRVASPPIRFPCYMGINIPTKEELIANKPEFKDIAGYIGATSVRYLSVEGLLSAVQGGIESHGKDERISSTTKTTRIGHCTACLTGKYPVELEW